METIMMKDNDSNNINKKLQIKSNNIKWLFYELLSGIIILSILFSSFLVCIITKTWVKHIDYPFSYVLFPSQFWSYFTYQSNLIVGLWFFFKSYFSQK